MQQPTRGFDSIQAGWLLTRRYRPLGDRALSGLATPAWLSLLTIFFGLGMAAMLWLLSMVTQ
ncbi:hypothetical protein [Xanthomonas sp. MUS 060]|uniref:hypothetical protein n=1 Tax=Xanthomonas sp. MUS 060 TaxID=1588031 RepID=UPI000B2C6BDB|nr:hypothetical protein [Xanthomonas sp. MUS 060]